MWRHRNKAKSLTLIFLILLSCLPLTLTLFVRQVHADPDWLDGWTYRKSHLILNATGADTNYQIKIKVHQQNLTRKFLTGWAKSSSNPLKNVSGQSWLTAVYSNYSSEDRFYVFRSEGITTTIKCWNLSRSDVETPENWIDEGTVFTGTHSWDDYRVEPHGIIFETQSMADAREGVGEGEGTRKWRMYYCGIPSGGKWGIGFCFAPENNLTDWTYYSGNPVYPKVGTIGFADSKAVIYTNEVWMAVGRYPNGVDKEFFTHSANGIDNWVDLDENYDDYNIVGGTLLSFEGYGILMTGNPSDTDDYEASWSTNGENFWNYSNNPIMEHGETGDWDAGLAWNSIAHDKDGSANIADTYYLFYFGIKDSVWKLGLATTSTLTEEGGDSGEDVGTCGNAKSDFGDIRITQSDGTTIIAGDNNGWMEEKLNNYYATIWVKIPENLTSQNQTMYVYYGNAGASWSDNGDQTFEFFDDFEDGSIDSNKWITITGSPSETGGYIHIPVDSGVKQNTTTYPLFSKPKVVRHKTMFSHEGTGKVLFVGIADPADAVPNLIIHANFGAMTQNDAGEENTEFSDKTNYHTYDELWRTDEAKYYKDGSFICTHTLYVSSVAIGAFLRAYLPVGAYYLRSQFYLVRKYTDSGIEPSHGSWGSQEQEAGGDSTAPTYSNVNHNTTIVSTPCNFSCLWQDETGLSGYIFGTNNSGSWVNETWTTLSGTSDTADVVKTLTSSVGITVQYEFWCNDTSDNWNNTGIHSLTTTEEGSDSEAPTYSDISHSTTEAGFSCTFKTLWQDNEGLSGYIFGTNNSGSWVNDTWTTLSGNPAWSSKAKTLNTNVGSTVQYQFWCNDTSDNWNNTGTQSLTITDTTAPSYSNTNHNTTLANTPCLFSCDWTDQVGLSGYIFGTDNSGSWINETWQAMTGKANSSETIKTLNSSIGITIQFRFWANDTNGNWKASSLELFDTTGEGDQEGGSAGGATPKPKDKNPIRIPTLKTIIIIILILFLASSIVGRGKKRH